MFTSNEIQYSYVYMSRINVPLKDRLACLSRDERKLAESFLQPKDSERFISRRWFYRHVLGLYCDVPAKALIFNQNNHGKPILSPEQNPEGISFNCSSSKNIAIIALAKQGDIGVDIEYIQSDFIVRQVSDQIFTGQEQTQIENSKSGTHIFFELWTKKEAFAKATGAGIVYAKPGKFNLTAATVRLAEDDVIKYLHIQKLSVDDEYASSIALINNSEGSPSISYIRATEFARVLV